MSRDYRALLRDRKAKSTKQNVAIDFCLDPSLLAELDELTEARTEAAHPYEQRITKLRADSSGSLAGPADTSPIATERDAAVAELDAQIEAKKAEIRDASLVLHFRAISATTYGALVDKHEPNKGDAEFRRFSAELTPKCWVKATTADGQDTDLAWADILAAEPSSGEIDLINTKVLAANRIGVDIPFSLRPSAKTREAGRK